MEKLTLEEMKELIDRADSEGDAILPGLAAGGYSRDEFRSEVRRFVLLKFLLTEEDASATDDIFTLAEMSVMKMLLMNERSSKLAQASKTCTSQSSVDVKKVLLSLALQDGVGVKLTPLESANATSTQLLADALYDKLHGVKSR